MEGVFKNRIFWTPKNTVLSQTIFYVLKSMQETPVLESVLYNGMNLSLKTVILDSLFVTKSFEIPGKYLVFGNKLQEVSQHVQSYKW